MVIVLLFLHENIACGAHWKRLNETLPMSTHKLCFLSRNNRITNQAPLLSRGSVANRDSNAALMGTQKNNYFLADQSILQYYTGQVQFQYQGCLIIALGKFLIFIINFYHTGNFHVLHSSPIFFMKLNRRNAVISMYLPSHQHLCYFLTLWLVW